MTVRFLIISLCLLCAGEAAAQTARKPRLPRPAPPPTVSAPAATALRNEIPGLVYVHQKIDLRPADEALMTLDGEPAPPLLVKNVTLGLVADAAGLIVTRLVDVTPGNPPLEVTVLGPGLNKPYQAKFLGVDSVTGLCVLKLENATLKPPQFAEANSLPPQLAVKLKGFHPQQGQSQIANMTLDRPRIHTTEARLIKAVKDFRYSPANPFYQLTTALTPVQDGSLVFEGEQTLFGLAVYDTNEGQSLVYPVARVLDIVAKVVKANESLAYGWLGATPDLDMTPPIGTIINPGGAKPELGVRVRAVFPDSPAEQAGLKPRDILLSVNDRRVESNAQLTSALRQLPPESEVTLRFKREAEYKVVKTKLAPAPASEPNQMLAALLRRLEKMKSQLNAMPTTDPSRNTLQGKVEAMDSIMKGIVTPAPVEVRLRVFFGLDVQPLTAQLRGYFAAPNGVLVTGLAEKQRAAEGGLQAGDVVVKVGAQEIHDVAKLLQSLDEAGGTAELTVVRRRATLTLKFTR